MDQSAIDDIRRRARSGPMLLLFRRGLAMIVTFASTITIARLLTPRDYGLAAMSIVILSFMQMFRDFGLTNALMRSGNVNEDEVSFLFWFNAAATIVMAAALALASPAIAAFYHEPIVQKIVLISSVGFIIEGLSLQHSALLKRNLRFSSVAAAESLGLTIAFVVGLSCAIAWRNVWAIVAMNMTQSIVISAYTIWKARWLPTRPRKPEAFRDLLQFGMNSSVFSFLNFLSRNSPTFIIGHIMGSSPLGLFNRAFSLFMLPMNNLLQPLTQATLPVMARLRGAPDAYAKTYLGLVRALCGMMAPAGAILIIGSTPLMTALLGPKWTQAGPLLSALSAQLIIYGLIWPTSDLLISQNRSAELRVSGLYDFALRVAGAAIGAMFGLMGVAVGLTIGLYLTAPLRVWQSGRRGPVSIRDQWVAFSTCLPTTIGAMAGGYASKLLAERLAYGEGGVALASFIGGGIVSLSAGLAVPRAREALFELLGSLTGRRALGS
jgi:polysaccharide transporter, PST family